MMYGVSWCIMHFQAAASDVENIAALDDAQALLGSRFDHSPKQFHAFAKDTRCAGYYLRRIEQVWRTLVVRKYLCPRQQLDERTGCSRVIKVDMCCKNMCYFLWIEAHFLYRI